MILGICLHCLQVTWTVHNTTAREHNKSSYVAVQQYMYVTAYEPKIRCEQGRVDLDITMIHECKQKLRKTGRASIAKL